MNDDEREAQDGPVPLSVVVLLVISGWALLSIIVSLAIAAMMEPRERADLTEPESVEADGRRDLAS